MKATINADGFLIVQPETDLEAYALKHWAGANLTGDWFNAAGQPALRVIVDLGAFGNAAFNRTPVRTLG
ncbi:hypothetical protein [Trinickia dinghuensis]|uniref:Uncharacterized protein n=1 Tax=Trinickia dinghuensis TaxID=2291023 RepID=A0A3D8K237_9BURK|nr:hypothetical protein [Trinickia dinghuensis]RDU99210.1 hypothetical protein DWV00_08780 [Trinickia dinghuensis]